MRLYEITLDFDGPWSYFLPAGDIRKYLDFCSNCHWPLHDTALPKSLIWQGGGDPGDFTDTTLGTFCSADVASQLATEFSDIKSIETVVENRAGEGNFGLLYEGKQIVQLTAALRIQLHSDRCTLKETRQFVPCPVCNRTVGYLDGVELQPVYEFAPSRGRPVNYRRRVPRQPGKGVFLFEDELQGHDFFHLGPYLPLHCTEKAKDFIVGCNFTNVDFLEVGETVRRGEPVPIGHEGC